MTALATVFIIDDSFLFFPLFVGVLCIYAHKIPDTENPLSRFNQSHAFMHG